MPESYTLTQEVLNLPASANYDTAGQVFTGTVAPDADDVTTTYPVQIKHTVTYTDPVTGRQVTESVTQVDKAFVVLENLTISGDLPDGTQNVAYSSQAPTVIGGEGPYTYEATGLPAGLTINETNGTVSGTPTESGTKNVVVTVTDTHGYTATATLPITINEPDTTAPVITPIDYQKKLENQPIDEITVTVNEPATIHVEGLPEGVIFDPDSNLIRGTPETISWEEGQEEQVYAVQVTAVDPSGNSATETFTLTIQRDQNNNGVADEDETQITFITDGNGTLAVNPEAEAWHQQTRAEDGSVTMWVLKDSVLNAIKAPIATATNPEEYTGYVWKTGDPLSTIALADPVIENGVYTAVFNKNVIEDPTTPDAPDGYLRLTFHSGAHGTLTTLAGAQVDTRTIDVLIGTDYEEVRSVVYDPLPDEGYAFTQWDNEIPAVGTRVTETDTTSYTAQYLPIVIENPTDPTPEGYKRITFTAGENGILVSTLPASTVQGQTLTYDIKATLTFGDVSVPTAQPTEGYGFINWTPSLPNATEVLSGLTEDAFTANFGGNVVEAEPGTTPPMATIV